MAFWCDGPYGYSVICQPDLFCPAFLVEHGQPSGGGACAYFDCWADRAGGLGSLLELVKDSRATALAWA
jgi:hypothetical protein